MLLFITAFIICTLLFIRADIATHVVTDVVG